MITRLEVERELRFGLARGRLTPIFGVEVGTFNADLARFAEIESHIAQFAWRIPSPYFWPSVVTLRTDLEGAKDVRDTVVWSEHLVPIDVSEEIRKHGDFYRMVRDGGFYWHRFPESDSEGKREGDPSEINPGTVRGLPTQPASIETARRNFFGGMGDMIFRQARWLNNKSSSTSAVTAKPKVTVESYPANRQAHWTRGHFFSLSTVFGKTLHTKEVDPGLYTFWLHGQSHGTHLGIWDIKTDETVTL